MHPFTTLIKLIIHVNLYNETPRNRAVGIRPYFLLNILPTQKSGNNTVYYFRTLIFFSILYFTIPTYCEIKTVKTVYAINETIPFI